MLKLVAALTVDPLGRDAVTECGGVELLLSSLQMRGQHDAGLVQSVAGALSKAAETPQGIAAMLGASSGNGVASLVAMVANREESVQMSALAALACLSNHGEGRAAIMQQNEAASALAQACPKAAKQGRHAVVPAVARVVCLLAEEPSARVWLVRSGAAVPLVVMLARETGEALAPLAAAVQRLTASDEAGQVAIAAAGGAEALVRTLQEGCTASKASAVHTLRLLAENSSTLAAVAASPSAVGTCVPLLSSDDPQAQEHAAATLARLGECGRAAEIASADGCLVALAHMLQRSNAAQLPAARAVCAVASERRALPAVCRACLPALVALAESDGETQDYAVSALFKLALGAEDEGEGEDEDSSWGEAVLAAMAKSAPAMKLMLQKLAAGTQAEKALAARSLLRLAAHPEAVEAIISGGGVPVLAKLSEAAEAEAEARHCALVLLARLASPKHAAAVAPAVDVLLRAIPAPPPLSSTSPPNHAAPATIAFEDANGETAAAAVAASPSLPLPPIQKQASGRETGSGDGGGGRGGGGAGAAAALLAPIDEAELTQGITQALAHLVAVPEARAALIKRGSSVCVRMLRRASNGAMQMNALGTLAGLATDDEGRAAVGAAGAAPELVRIAKGRVSLGRAPGRRNSTTHFVPGGGGEGGARPSDSPLRSGPSSAEGPSPPPGLLMRRGSSVSAAPKPTKMAAAKATRILCSLAELTELHGPLIAAGAFVPLVGLLRDASADDQAAAAAAIERLTDRSKEAYVSRLQSAIRDTHARKMQRAAFNQVMSAAFDPSVRGQISAVAEGVLPPLLALLLMARGANGSGGGSGGGDGAKMAAHAISIVANLAECAETRHAVAAEVDAVAACLMVLRRSPDAKAQEHAAAALVCLCDAGRRADAIAQGAAEVLLQALKAGGAERVQAARAICSLASHVGCYAEICKGGLSTLVAVSGGGGGGGGRGEAQGYAVTTLHKLIRHGDDVTLATVAKHALVVKAVAAELNASGTSAEQKLGVSSLLQLTPYPESFAAVVSGGGLAPLVAIAKEHADAPTRKGAVSYLALLAASSPPNAVAVATTAGAVEALLAALQTRKAFSKETSWLEDGTLTQSIAKALEALMAVAAARGVAERTGVVPLVQLLRDNASGVQACALGALDNLTAEGGTDAVRTVNAAAPAAALIHVINQADAVTLEAAVRLLDRLSTDASGCNRLVSVGGVPSVLPLLFATSHEARLHALNILGAVAEHVASLDALRDACNEPSVEALTAMMMEAGLDPKGQQSAAAVLGLLATHQPLAPAMVRSGAAGDLALLALPSSLSTERTKTHAAAALEALAANVAPRFYESRLKGSPLLRKPLFWWPEMIAFVSDGVEAKYPRVCSSLDSYPALGFYIELFHFCAIVLLRQEGQYERSYRRADKPPLTQPTSASADDELGARAASGRDPFYVLQPLGNTAVTAIAEVMESFENEPNALAFAASIFPDVIARTVATENGFDAFNTFDVSRRARAEPLPPPPPAPAVAMSAFPYSLLASSSHAL